MAKKEFTPLDVSNVAVIKRFAESGTPREDLQPFFNNIKSKKAKAWAEQVFAEAVAKNTAAAMRSAQNTLRMPKIVKTPARRLRKNPARVINNDATEYRRLNNEYHKRTGKWFKRTKQEMRNRMSKLDAIKYRVELMDKGKAACEEALRKNDPEFYLGGAL